MIVLIPFAFLAGIVTIFSPCILPILPVVLSGGLGGSRSRPFGIVTGFVTRFTFFTLFLASLVKLFGIPADSLRNLSVIVIATFGLTLIVPRAQAAIETLFARLSSLVPAQSPKSGFFGGILIGLSLGLLWTPCVGPILASVISLAITGTISGTAILITLAYSIGTAVPMLVIIFTGRRLISLVPNPARIQKLFGGLMLLTALAIYGNYDRKLQTYILDKFPQYGVGLTGFEDNPAVKERLDQLNITPMPTNRIGRPMFDTGELPNLGPAPKLIPGGQWFNSEPLTLKGLKGKVVLLDFWTYTCINCIRTLPYLRSWDDKYRDQGLVIIGIHTPEFEFEKNPQNITRAIADFKLKYPVMQDNDYATWRAYNNHYWPAKYLIDKEGNIRYTHFGEGEYDQTELAIQQLLAVSEPISNPSHQITSRTPELYIGSDRYQEGYTEFSGDWIDHGQYRTAYKTARLTLNFNAQKVFLVMRPSSKATPRIRIILDDQTLKEVNVANDKLYELLDLPNPGSHALTIEFLNHPVDLFAFTFG